MNGIREQFNTAEAFTKTEEEFEACSETLKTWLAKKSRPFYVMKQIKKLYLVFKTHLPLQCAKKITETTLSKDPK